MARAGETTLRLLIEPIQVWLDDPDATEICINRPGEVWVERRGEWQRHPVPLLDFGVLEAIATLAAAMTQQDIGPNHPLCATALPDGQRVQICRPPAVGPGLVSVTIRRPSSFRPTLGALDGKGLFKQATGHEGRDASMATAYHAGDQRALLAAAVIAKKNILICGATGSGKTTLARALIEAIPSDERLITIEDTPEWQAIPQRNRVALFYSKGEQGSA